MLRILTRSIRRRTARWLVLTYLACIIAPPVALTFAAPAVAAHCMSDDHMSAPVHLEGTGHDHAMHDHAMHEPVKHEPAKHGSSQGSEHPGGKAGPVNCCGMFCVTGATVDMTVAIGGPVHGRVLHPRIEARLGGIGPHRIDRPPNALVSL
jgi:hypothetical protein